MRKVVLYTLTSLDGAVDHPGQYFPATDPTESGAPLFDHVMVDIETPDDPRTGRGAARSSGCTTSGPSYWPDVRQTSSRSRTSSTTCKKHVATSSAPTDAVG